MILFLQREYVHTHRTQEKPQDNYGQPFLDTEDLGQ